MTEHTATSTPQSILSTGWQGAAAAAVPLFGAMLVDFADLLSLGPQAVPLALLVAAPLGWGIAAALGLSRNWRLASAVVAGVYVFLPGAELIPAATATSLLAQLAVRLPRIGR